MRGRLLQLVIVGAVLLTGTAVFSGELAHGIVAVPVDAQLSRGVQSVQGRGVKADLAESFDGATFPPTNWGQTQVAGTGLWTRVTAGTYPTITPHSGAGMAKWYAYSYSSGTQARLYTPVLSFSAGAPSVSFWMSHDTGYSGYIESITTQISTNGGTNWTDLGTRLRYDASCTTPCWQQESYDLTAYAGEANVRIGFLAYSDYGNNFYFDDVLVQGLAELPNLLYGSNAIVSDVCPVPGPKVDYDGIVDPGEEVEIDVTVDNSGLGAATGVSGVLSTATAGVTVTTSTANYDDIPAGGSGTSLTPFEFEVDPGVACGTVINFTLTMTYAGGSAVLNFTVPTGTLANLAPVYTENFDSVTAPGLPAGWAWIVTAGTDTDTAWLTTTTGDYPVITPPSAPNVAEFNSWYVSAPGAARLYQTSSLDLSTLAAPAVVDFLMYHDTGYTNADTIQVQVSTDGGTTWTNVGSPVYRYLGTGINEWREHQADISAYAGMADVRLAFLGTSAYGNECYIDDVSVVPQEWQCVCSPPGLFLNPEVAAVQGCNGAVQTHTFELYNKTGADFTFDLTYDLVGDAVVDGPATLFVADLGTVAFDVDLTPDLCTSIGDTLELTVTADGNGYTDDSVLTKNVVAGSAWGGIAPDPNNGFLDNVAAAYDGKVWSITGWGADPSVRTYDPVTDVWTIVAGSAPPFGGNEVVSGCVAGSKVFIYGDTSTTGLTGLWSYDMATNTWLNETPSGTPPAATGIWAPAWAHDADTGYCYLTGGATAPGAGDLTSVYVYDPVGNAWMTPLPDFSAVRDFHAAFVFLRPADEHKLLCVVGGTDATSGLTSTQCYDFTTAAWNAENADLGALPYSWWGMGYASKLHYGTDLQLWLVDGVVDDTYIVSWGIYYDFSWGFWADGGTPTSPAAYRLAAVALDNEIYKIDGIDAATDTYTGESSRHFQCPMGCPTDLEITKTDGVTTVVPGAGVTYTITATNLGPNDVLGYVEDFFSAELTAVTWTCGGAGGGACSASGSGDIGDDVDLPAGGSVTYTVTATVAAGAVGTLDNTATVYPGVGVEDTNYANNTATDSDTVVVEADLTVAKTDGACYVLPGGSTTYTITVGNLGPNQVTGATVADTFDAVVTGVTWTCVGAGGGTCAASGSGNINDTTVFLPMGGSVVYTAIATVDAGATGVLLNTATASVPAGVTELDLVNNSDGDLDALELPLFCDGFESGTTDAWSSVLP